MKPVKSREVWKWPEWRAFAERLGIPLEPGTTGCAVVLECKENAEVFIDITRLPAELLAKMRARQGH